MHLWQGVLQHICKWQYEKLINITCVYAYICHIKDCYLCNFSRIQCICWKYLINSYENARYNNQN